MPELWGGASEVVVLYRVLACEDLLLGLLQITLRQTGYEVCSGPRMGTDGVLKGGGL